MAAAIVGGIGIATNVGLSIWGGNKQAAAARAQAEAQNKATMARYQYDHQMWGMKKRQLQAERMEAVEGIMVNARNEGKIKAYKDAAALDQYDYALKIRHAQQASNEAAFDRSEKIYTEQSSLNEMSAKGAMDSNIIKQQESYDEMMFDRNDAYIEMLQMEGKLRARSSSGRSAAKGVQSTLADYGRQIEMLNASLDSTGRNTRGVLEEILRDKSSADLSAYAQKMLEPGTLPMPIKPRPLPVAELHLPRVLQEYDFGPQPVMGAMASPGAAASMVWGQTMTSIGGAIGGGLTNIAGSLPMAGSSGAWIDGG